MLRLTNMHPRSPTSVSRRINYAPYSRPTPRIADKELFIEPYAEVERVGVQWASLDNKRRNSREKKIDNRSTGVNLFFFSPLERRARIPSALNPLWRPRDIREAAKGILRDDREGRDPLLSARVHFAFNPTALRCHSWDIKFEV